MAASSSRIPSLLTIPATAEKLGVSVRTVRRWIDALCGDRRASVPVAA